MFPQSFKEDIHGSSNVMEILEEVLRVSEDAILISDTSHDIVMANDAFYNIFTKERIELRNDNFFQLLEELDVEAAYKWLDIVEIFEKKVGFKDFVYTKRIKVSKSFFTVSLSILERKKRNIRNLIISVWRDSSKQKKTQKKLRESENELKFLNLKLEEDVKQRTEELNQSKKKYEDAYNQLSDYKDLLIHDMNHILHTIKLSIDLCSRYPYDSEKLLDLHELMKEEIDLGIKLIKNIQKLSKLDEEEAIIKPLDIYPYIMNAIDYIDHSFKNRKIQIVLNPENFSFFINANTFLLEVFQNILINSVNYNYSEVVKISISISRKIINKTWFIQMEFIDNARGIPSIRKKIIFERGKKELKGSKGLGIGLSIVKKIVETFKGEIWVEDKVKGDYTQGSKFIIIIPEAS